MHEILLPGGDKIPQFGLGTWQAQSNEVEKTLLAALNIGYRHLDCSPVYANEADLGAALKKTMTASKVTRQQLWLTSKLWNSFHAPEDVEPALKQTLQNLKTDYLDLYLMHWPLCFSRSVGLGFGKTADDVPRQQVPLQETWQAMHECQQKGLFKHIGVSNFSQRNIQYLLDHSDVKPVMNQIECHVHLQQRELVTFCQQQHIEITAYAPIGSPAIFKALNLQQPRDMVTPLQDETVLAIADKHQCTAAQILLAWLLAHRIIVVPKSSHEKRLAENWAAQEIKLDKDDMQQLNQLDQQQRFHDGKIWEFPGGWFKAETLWQ